MIRIKILVLLLLVLSINTYASISMRNCVILPVISDNDNFSFRVMEDIEAYIKDSNWCYYKSNSKLIDILSKYKKNIGLALQNKEILSLISRKSDAGSIIKIEVGGVKKNTISMEIYGENGFDLYFKEEVDLREKNIFTITKKIKTWLNDYSSYIPYNGRIIDIKGEEFSIDAGDMLSLNRGKEVNIYRVLEKSSHPLFNKVIDWKKEKIARGKITNSDKRYSQAKVTHYFSNKKIKNGDWIKLDKSSESTLEAKKYKKSDIYSFGSIGNIKFLFGIHSSKVKTSLTGDSALKGNLFSGEIQGDLWLTRNYWTGLEFENIFSDIKGSGRAGGITEDVSFKKTYFKFAYKYLPMGYFYGPQMDSIVGLAKHSFDYGNNNAIGFTNYDSSGIFLGFKGMIPIRKIYNINAEIRFILSPKYDLTGRNITVNQTSISSYMVRGEFNYRYNPLTELNLSLKFSSDRVKFVDSDDSLTHRELVLKTGLTFIF